MRPFFEAGRRGAAPEVVHDRVLTVPNVITALRLAGLPVFAWLLLAGEHYGGAFWTLVAIGSTDWVDGYVARRFDQVSRVGKMMDPVVDRLLVATVLISLLVAGIVPWWAVASIVGRDLLLVAGALVLFHRIPAIAVTRTGKFATACLLVGLPGFLLGHMEWVAAETFTILAWLVTSTGVVAYWVAGGQYLRAALALRRQAHGPG